MKSKFEPIIKEAIEFFIDEIAISDEPLPAFKVVEDNSFRGRYDTEMNIIFISNHNKTLTEFDVAQTVLHVMVHWKQVHDGRFNFVTKHRQLSVKFDNKIFKLEEDNRDKPWEIEAYEQESKLLSKFIAYRS